MLLCVLVPFHPVSSKGITASVVSGSSTISNQLEAGSIIVRHIKSISVPSLPLRVYSPIRSTHKASHGFEMTNLLCREFPLLMLVSFVDLTCMTVFDMPSDGVSHTFPIHYGM